MLESCPIINIDEAERDTDSLSFCIVQPRMQAAYSESNALVEYSTDREEVVLLNNRRHCVMAMKHAGDHQHRVAGKCTRVAAKFGGAASWYLR